MTCLGLLSLGCVCVRGEGWDQLVCIRVRGSEIMSGGRGSLTPLVGVGVGRIRWLIYFSGGWDRDLQKFLEHHGDQESPGRG